MLDLREPLLDPDEDPRVEAALTALAAALQAPPDELTVRRHRNAIAAANGHLGQTLLRRSVTATAVAAVLAVLLAFAGALPENAQRIAADLASRVGLMIPRPAGDVLPPAGTGEAGAETSSEAGRSGDAQDAVGAGGAGIGDDAGGDGQLDDRLLPHGRPSDDVREGQRAEDVRARQRAENVRAGQRAEDVRAGQRAEEVLEVVPGLGPIVEVPAGPPADRPVEPAPPASSPATGSPPAPGQNDGGATPGNGAAPSHGAPGQATDPTPEPGTSTGPPPSDPPPQEPEPTDPSQVDPPPATDEPDGGEVVDPEPPQRVQPAPPRRPTDPRLAGRSADHRP